MKFNSDKFTYNGIYCDDMKVSLLWGDDDFIDYGLTYDRQLNYDGLSWKTKEDKQPDTIKLNIVYDIENVAQTWTSDKIKEVEDWLITDYFTEFISDDNYDTSYYFRVVNIIRKFNGDMKGWLEVEFQPLSNNAFINNKLVINGVDDVIENIRQYNIVNENYDRSNSYPTTELKNITTDVELINVTTGETFTLTDIKGNIIVDHELKTIFDDKGNNLIANSNRNWLYLKHDINKIKVKGSCKCIILSQSEVRV